MPELPEVETIKRDLAPKITGRCFTSVTLHWPRMVRIPSPQAFARRLISKHIDGVDRRGKYLIFRLASGEALILHLRMSGSLRLGSECPDDPYVRAVFDLDDGSRLHFRDPRKLGVMWLVEDENVVVGKLGPEPLDPEFTEETLRAIIDKRSASIKALLCDQSLIAGVGNMYADEALFAAAIHPLRRADSLSHSEITRLHRTVCDILRKAIDSGGASISDYVRPDGNPGQAQFVFKAAHRLRKPCPVCGTPIERIPIRQRGSYFCPRCQPKEFKKIH
ncbi:MAG: bifunctional DNA-formamidopyrimidine glycosylase/DNA-(apurinic or apyrimidinic site) lyase [Chloroflexota bacterium]|nr:bifunctional DNA-formamidopyrimidine glycosylase/DNA-(apurinic or apyrimidinic site) lyase [Chloroflexota bacterium]